MLAINIKYKIFQIVKTLNIYLFTIFTAVPVADTIMI